ncbi:Glutamine amidotransferase class-I [Prochlorococcus marinus str. MIT 9515]|uniref:Glutamine amidotransferase class-I n=1 Tax=Prochlorococcus marinus (strain MIT 9515) TaxID=167542 RepID=A2BWC4_PROM5|nr:type 1 glutamine amidotransferase [Prochlorococcus marinus]ABM72085.1 Glutamine amidotransferase class-I [Prochlorococcus marinus str. MIT 9515]
MKRLLVLQHIEIEGPGLFYQIAKERQMNIEIIRLDQGDNLPKTNEDDLILIMGGPMGIQDIGSKKYPWLKKERDFIKSELKKKTPIIGVCLGAQLLANAAGGDIEILKQGNPPKPLPEIGWSQIFFNQTNNDIKKFCKTPFHVLHWHGDKILLPGNAELIASSKRCKEQFFRIGERAYGLQFHIESIKEMTEKWIKEDKIFINRSLGKNGQAILREEEKKFGEKTVLKRRLLINELFNLLSKH